MVQIENSLQNYVDSTLWNGFSWAFKTLKPWASRVSAPWTPSATMESPTKILRLPKKVVKKLQAGVATTSFQRTSVKGPIASRDFAIASSKGTQFLRCVIKVLTNCYRKFRVFTIRLPGVGPYKRYRKLFPEVLNFNLFSNEPKPIAYFQKKMHVCKKI